MKRTVAVAAVSLIVLAPFLWTVEAWARAGRGGSSGSRGSRSHSAPATARPSSTPGSPGTSDVPSTPATTPTGSGWGGALAGLIAGGLLGSLLFGGEGGFGFTDLMALGFLAFLVIRKMRSAQPEPAAAASYAGAVAVRSFDTRDAPSPWSKAGPVGQARRQEQGADPAEVARGVTDLFLKVQAAWTARDMESAAAFLTPEMRAHLQADCDRMRAQGRVNRIENVSVRAVEVTETWQDPGYNFMTVRIQANLLDYTIDEKTEKVVEGSATEAVTFEEYWTLTRAVWVKAWRLSAIQQAPA
jgi:predicted lipid-binding transport protein (Tim44 family)